MSKPPGGTAPLQKKPSKNVQGGRAAPERESAAGDALATSRGPVLRAAIVLLTVAALVAAGYFLGKKSGSRTAGSPASSPAGPQGPATASGQGNSSTPTVEAKGSLLPSDALGTFLAFLVVTAAKDFGQESFQSSSDYKLEIKAGPIVLNRWGRPIVTSLSIRKPGADGFRFAMRDMELAGSSTRFNSMDVNCSFRIDVMSTQDLTKSNQFIVSLERWTLDEQKGSCRIRF